MVCEFEPFAFICEHLTTNKLLTSGKQNMRSMHADLTQLLPHLFYKLHHGPSGSLINHIQHHVDLMRMHSLRSGSHWLCDLEVLDSLKQLL